MAGLATHALDHNVCGIIASGVVSDAIERGINISDSSMMILVPAALRRQSVATAEGRGDLIWPS
jgi:phage terminase large subunit-like protein